MLTDEVRNKVKKEIRSGIPEGEVKNRLANEGYSDEEIDELFRPHHYDMRSWYLTFAVIFLLGGIYWMMRYGSIRPMLLSGGMLGAYYLEKKRLEKTSS